MRADVEGRLAFRLTFADVDAVQFFFANYYRWMERALAELMAACGYPRRQSLAERVGFPVVESGCRYKQRALVDEELQVVARFSSMSARSFRVAYEFLDQAGASVAEGFTHHVCVDLATMRSRPVPEAFRASSGEGGGGQAATDELAALRRLTASLIQLQRGSDSPAVERALRLATYYCYLARDFLGDCELAPELDGDLGLDPERTGGARQA